MKLNLALVLIATILFSCKKDKEENKPTGCPITVEGLAGTYRYTSIMYKDSPNGTTIDMFATMEECEKEQTFVLKGDGTYTYSDACAASESSSGNWQVKDNTLAIDDMQGGTISSYDCKKLVYYVNNALQEGDRMTLTLEKQ